MIEPGPIVYKEFVQATHQRRTVVLRTLLPGVAVLLVAPQLLGVLVASGQDWRTVANICRPVFTVCAWLQVIALPPLAMLYAMGSLREEWSRRTMEVLCVTPISRGAILYGKFACAVGKVLLLWLTLLPVIGIWVKLGRIPPHLALGSLSLIGAGTLLFAALAFVQSASYRPGRRRVTLHVDVLLLYLLVSVVLGAGVWPGRPLLVAAVPHWAFWYVMQAKAPGGMAVEAFIPLAVGVPLGVAAVALALTPVVFRFSFRRYLGAPGWRSAVRSLVPAAMRRRFLRRPAMKPDESPFAWQERGGATAGLRWGLWITCGITLLVAVVVGAAENDFGFFRDPDSLLIVAGIGAAVVSLLSGVHACGVFAREKMQATAEFIILTGNTALSIYRAKLLSIAWSLRVSFVVLAILPIAHAVAVGAWTWAASAVLAAGLFGPIAAAVIGLVFGAAARSPSHALGGILMSIVWSVLLAWCPPLSFIGAIVGTVLMLALVKAWTVWRLSFLMAFIESLLGGIILFIFMFLSAMISSAAGDDWQWIAALLALAAFTVLNATIWFAIGVSAFERSMLNQTLKPGRR